MWLTVALIVLVVLGISILFPSLVGGAWSPTSMRRVHAMLEAAQLRPGELLIDLGAGDGRIILTAARHYQARAIGVEIDPLRYYLCRLRIALSGLSGRVSMRWANFFEMDLGEADVVTFFLSQGAADRLAEKLRKELKPGARVVSHQRPLTGWTPYQVDPVHDLYVYRVTGAPQVQPVSVSPEH